MKFRCGGTWTEHTLAPSDLFRQLRQPTSPGHASVCVCFVCAQLYCISNSYMHLPHLPEKQTEKLFSPAESETHDPKKKWSKWRTSSRKPQTQPKANRAGRKWNEINWRRIQSSFTLAKILNSIARVVFHGPLFAGVSLEHFSCRILFKYILD